MILTPFQTNLCILAAICIGLATIEYINECVRAQRNKLEKKERERLKALCERIERYREERGI